jgi:hypothetical protein
LLYRPGLVQQAKIVDMVPIREEKDLVCLRFSRFGPFLHATLFTNDIFYSQR